MVVAKTDAAHRGLAELFADHGRARPLEREYLALVWGSSTPRPARWTLRLPVTRSIARR